MYRCLYTWCTGGLAVKVHTVSQKAFYLVYMCPSHKCKVSWAGVLQRLEKKSVDRNES